MTQEVKLGRAKTGYIPSLDGWRAIAIFGVLMTHDLPIRIGRFSNERYKGYGGLGVDLFFAISGILICTRLLQDERKLGRIDLKSFYTRRLFRIQPALLAYLAAAGLLMLIGVSHDSVHKWIGALFLYINFQYNKANPYPGEAFIAHFWTLAVEEHFYLLLSLLLVLIRRYRIAAFSVLLPGLILGQVLLAPHHYDFATSSRRTYWVVQYLLFPAYVALLLQRREVRSFAERWLQPYVAFAITAVVLLVEYLPRQPYLRLSHIFGLIDALPYCFTLWVVATMLHAQSWTTRLLELAPLRFMGRLSYSVYLWHILFFIPSNPGALVSAHWLLFLAKRPWKYIASFAIAVASYFFVEKPMIRLGHRIAPPATPGHRDLDVNRPLAGAAAHT